MFQHLMLLKTYSLLIFFLTITIVSLACIAALKHPRTPPTNPSVDFPSGDSEHVGKRARPMGITDEVVRFGLSLHSAMQIYHWPLFFQPLIFQFCCLLVQLIHDVS